MENIIAVLYMIILLAVMLGLVMACGILLFMLIDTFKDFLK